jgi:hypothetical protein
MAVISSAVDTAHAGLALAELLCEDGKLNFFADRVTWVLSFCFAPVVFSRQL